MQEVPGSMHIGDIAFYGDKIWLTVTISKKRGASKRSYFNQIGEPFDQVEPNLVVSILEMIRFRPAHVNPKWERDQIEGIKREMEIKELFKHLFFNTLTNECLI